jgi:CheY-like chemotaxis protein
VPPSIIRQVHTPHIVIVDDDDSVRSVVVEIARDAKPSADVSSHASALHALQEIHSSGVDLLITNCHMPDMDGPTLVRTLRAEKNAIPVIMVSGSDDARAVAEELGVDRFIPKHTVHAALADAILSLLEA